jgi:CheY-like chemotaxis protein
LTEKDDIFSENEKNTNKKRILLADDDRAMRRFLEVVLRREGYEVTAADDGAAAMQLALTQEFEACVFDAMMPNLTGYELCRIFKQHPQLKTIPIVILSGLDGEETNSEINARIVKTANLQNELLQTLNQLFAD